jgi:hypothetical protein
MSANEANSTERTQFPTRTELADRTQFAARDCGFSPNEPNLRAPSRQRNEPNFAFRMLCRQQLEGTCVPLLLSCPHTSEHRHGAICSRCSRQTGHGRYFSSSSAILALAIIALQMGLSAREQERSAFRFSARISDGSPVALMWFSTNLLKSGSRWPSANMAGAVLHL